MAKHISTDNNTEDNVIIDSYQMSQAPINSSNMLVTTANLNPTDTKLIIINTAVVKTHGIWVK